MLFRSAKEGIETTTDKLMIEPIWIQRLAQAVEDKFVKELLKASEYE